METSLAEVHLAVARAVPDREAIVFRDRRLTYAQLADRTQRLANLMKRRGLGRHAERSALRNFESGQDHVAIYMYNCNEYIESILGSLCAAAAPLNINYRYTEEELSYLLRDSKPRAIIYHARFAPPLQAVLHALDSNVLLIQVADESGNALLPGAVDYEQELASSSPNPAPSDWSADDLYILYTGGTTGMPKGVLWRSADLFMATLGGRRADGTESETLAEVVERARTTERQCVLPSAPMMHGGSQWAAVTSLLSGFTVAIQSQPQGFDPTDILDTIAREKVTLMLIIGDAFARPLIDDANERGRDLSSLKVLASGGAALTAKNKVDLMTLFPDAAILDAVGSSETGHQGSGISQASDQVQTGNFEVSPNTGILSQDKTEILSPDNSAIGWLAQRGRVPLGYLGDADKSAATFPIINATRWAVPGDMARYRPDGTIDLLGRASVTINSGGEKIFAEEVEHALKLHPSVYDAVVCGRPSERWGQEVVAIVSLRAGEVVAVADLLAACAKHIARFKLPKAVLFREQVVRSPSGKADYRWAREQAVSS